MTGDSSKKPLFSTHKSLTKASDAFRFLQDRYNKALPPTPAVHNLRGPSVNDAVAESSSAPKTAATSRTPRMPFVHEPGRPSMPLGSDTYNILPKAVCFSPGTAHISHSRTISPLGLPLLTRPYSSSFSRARSGTNHSSSDETTAPSPSRSLSESSHPPSPDMTPRTPLTSDLLQGSPVYARMRPAAIVVSPSQSSAYEYLQDKKLNSGFATAQDTGIADREVIRTSRALRTTSGVNDKQYYDRHVPTQSVCMQSPTREDRRSQIGHTRIHIPSRQGRAGLGISFDFNSGNDSDSVGDGQSDDQQEITPGRPTVVLVPSGSRSDRGEAPASASARASVNLELEREGCGPRFAPGLQFPLESESQGSQSCASSFYTAQEAFLDSRWAGVSEHGDGHARKCTSGTLGHASGTPRRAPDFSPTLHLDFVSNPPLAASAVPALGVSSSPNSQDHLHHGTQFIFYLQ
jgi:hypothetical protein